MKEIVVIEDMSNLIYRNYHSWLAQYNRKANTKTIYIESKNKKFIVKQTGNLISINNVETGSENVFNGSINKDGYIELEGENPPNIIKGIVNLNKANRYKEMEIIEERLYKFYIDKYNNIYIIRTDDKNKSLYGINNKDGRVSHTNYINISNNSIVLNNGKKIENINEIRQNENTKDTLKEYIGKIRDNEIFMHKDLIINNSINSLLKDMYNMQCKPENVYCCFDSKSWRKDFLEEYYKKKPIIKGIEIEDLNYKGQRDKSDSENIHIILEKVEEIVQKLNMNYYKKEGLEGDDFMAMLSEILSKENKRIINISNDADFQQLISDNVELYDPKKPRDNGRSGGFVILKEHKLFKNIEKEVTKSIVGKDEINSKPEYADKIRENLDNIEKVLPNIFLLTKIMAGDKSDNISSIVPKIKLEENLEIKINFGEITVLSEIIKTYLTTENKDFSNISDTIIKNQSSKLFNKMNTELKKYIKSKINVKGMSRKEINKKIEENMPKDLLTLENIEESIRFLYIRNKKMISFKDIDDNIKNKMLEYHKNNSPQKNTNKEISIYLNNIGMVYLANKYKKSNNTNIKTTV